MQWTRIAILSTLTVLAGTGYAQTVIANSGSLSYSSTSSSGQFQIQKFDSSLGTLDSIEYSLFLSYNGTASVTNTSSSFTIASIGGSASESVRFTDNILLASNSASDSSTWTVAANATQSIVAGGVNTATGAVSSVYHSRFIGLDKIFLNTSISASLPTVSGQNLTVNSRSVSGTTSMRLTYHYTAVPEPSVFVAMGGALLVVARRRRAKTKSPR